MSYDDAIVLTNVSKQYQLYEKPSDRLRAMLPWNHSKTIGRVFHALDEINLTIGHGEVIGVVGRNGAGKSTLLQIICKTLPPSSGNLEVTGRIAALLELGSGFNPEFSGRENVYLSAAIAGMNQSEIDAKFDSIVAFSEIGDFIDHPVKTYSSGMLIRLAFSVAISVEPDILVIDEALSVGDGAFARKSFDRIMALKARGTTILFCSHALYQIEALCDRAIWLKDGTLEMSGDAQSVCSAYQQFLSKITSNTQQNTINTPTEVSASTGIAPRIRHVTIEGSDSKSDDNVIFVSGSDDVEILIDFETPSNIIPPTVAVVITNEAGIQVCSFSTHIDSAQPLDGQSSIRLILPQIPLLKGNYEVDVFLLCEQGIHVYEHVRNCAHFQVTQTHLEVGVVHIPRKWVN